MLNIPWLYTVEQGKNRDRSEACDLLFFFQFLDMIFSAVNCKANKNFVRSLRTYLVSLISVVFFFHVHLI